MKHLVIRVIRAFLVLILALNCFSCSSSELDYCDSLKALAKNEGAMSKTEYWVDNEILSRNYRFDDLLIGGGMWPGRHWLLTDFNWNILSFDPQKSQIRLIDAEIASSDGEIKGFKSVFFGERSGKGILVRALNSDNYGVSDKYLMKISDRISIVCRQRK